MNTIKRKIELLEMMGYKVLVNEHYMFIIVSITTKQGYHVSFTVNFEDLSENYAIEHIVNKMNHEIIEELQNG